MAKQLTMFTPELPLPALRTIKRALVLLDQHLLEPGVAFTSTQAARDWLRLKMGPLEREVFVVLYLNNQNQLLAHETLFTGTISHTEVHPREVVKRALYFNAAAVIFAHNHPSGEVTPSQGRQGYHSTTVTCTDAGGDPGARPPYRRWYADIVVR